MQPVTTAYGSLQSALFEGIAKAAPEVAKGMLPVLVPLLTNLDKTWPYLRVALRAYELASKRGKLPTPESAAHALAYAGRELLSDKTARYWLKLKPIWADPPEIV
ncbi:MAG: hypothetical protein AMXMBFR56_77070 [Polyangiaceae bacterium]